MVALAGFPGAGIVMVDNVPLLVDDVGRLFATGRFTVLGFVDIDGADGTATVPTSGGAKKERSSRSSRSSRPQELARSNLAERLEPAPAVDRLALDTGQPGAGPVNSREEMR